MKLRHALFLVPLGLITGLGAVAAQDQLQQPYETVEETRQALADARSQGEAARQRAEALEANARTAVAAADRTAEESAALAARIQQSEAEIAANEARIRLLERDRIALRGELAQGQRPLVRLTGALQRLARRPPILSLLRPGSLREAVYLRATLESMMPEVERRTAGVRTRLARARDLERQTREAQTGLRTSIGQLAERREQLNALESRQRLASRAAGVVADREAERARALGEQARDLSQLVGDLGKASALREELAALPGPVLRPPLPQQAQVGAAAPSPPSPPTGAPARYLLPAAGRVVAGFGDEAAGRPRSRGVSIMARSGAQAVAPAAGRVVFSGTYQGYGNIVIIEHGGGWTSLVTGLAALDTRVGSELVAGAPLGTAGPGRPVLTLELRHNGEPVNPLDFLKG